MKKLLGLFLLLLISLQSVVSVQMDISRKKYKRLKKKRNSKNTKIKSKIELTKWYTNLGWGFLTGLTGGLNQDIEECFRKVVWGEEVKKEPEVTESWAKSSPLGKIAIVFEGLDKVKDLICLPFTIASTIKEGGSKLKDVAKTVVDVASQLGSAVESIVGFVKKIPKIAEGDEKLQKLLEEDNSGGITSVALNVGQNIKKESESKVPKPLKDLKNKISEVFNTTKDTIFTKFKSLKDEAKNKIAEITNVLKSVWENSDLKAFIDGLKAFLKDPCFQAFQKILSFVIKIIGLISSLTAKAAAAAASQGATTAVEVAWLVVKIISSVCGHLGIVSELVTLFANAVDSLKTNDQKKKLEGFQKLGEILGKIAKLIADVAIEIATF